MSTKLIVALDFTNERQTLAFLNSLNTRECAVKIGSELFTRCGPKFVQKIVAQEFKVFLDLKFHDIPQQVANACKAAADLGVWMLSLHALGGVRMMLAAKEAIALTSSSQGVKGRPLLIAVTVLTSMDETEYENLGMQYSLSNEVKHLAQLAQSSGLDGVVSSAFEVQSIKQCCGENFLSITPGIRLANDKHDDQARVFTPQEAIKAGSDFLVIGRSITKSKNPTQVIHKILQVCGNAI